MKNCDSTITQELNRGGTRHPSVLDRLLAICGTSGVAFVVLFSLTNSASANVQSCVGTAEQLQAALTFAATNESDDDIRIVEGRYVAPTDGFVATLQEGDADRGLSISGAWNSDCTARTGEPRGTTLSGGDVSRVLRIAFVTPGATASVSIETLTIEDGNDNDGAFQFDYAINAGTLTIDRVGFFNNRGAIYGAFQIATTGTVLITNSVAAGNTSSQFRPVGGLGILAGGKAALINNTFVDNAGLTLNGLDLSAGIGATILLQNNILANDANASSPPSLLCRGNPAAYARLTNNSIDRKACENATLEAELNAPGITSLGTYELALSSDLIDAGKAEVSPQGAWQPAIPDKDFAGRPRIMGNGIDAGALEFPGILYDGFEE